MYVCVCKAVTDRQIRQAVELGARSLADLKESLGVATGCGKCAPCAREVLRAALEEHKTSTANAAVGYALVPGPA